MPRARAPGRDPGKDVQMASSRRVTDAKTLTRRFVEEVLNRHDLDAVAELLGPGFVDRTPRPGQGPGPEGFAEMIRGLIAGFPDAHWEIAHLIGEGDTVVVRILFTGTHLGPFLGHPATGRPVRMSGVHIARVVDGVMVEHWRHVDELDLLDQLGLMDLSAMTGTPLAD